MRCPDASPRTPALHGDGCVSAPHPHGAHVFEPQPTIALAADVAGPVGSNDAGQPAPVVALQEPPRSPPLVAVKVRRPTALGILQVSVRLGSELPGWPGRWSISQRTGMPLLANVHTKEPPAARITAPCCVNVSALYLRQAVGPSTPRPVFVAVNWASPLEGRHPSSLDAGSVPSDHSGLGNGGAQRQRQDKDDEQNAC